MSRYCAASLRWTLKSRQRFVSGSRIKTVPIGSTCCAAHLHVRSHLNLSLHFEVSSRYVDNAEKELQNYVEKLLAQIFLVQK